MKKTAMLFVLLAACLTIPAQAQDTFTPSWIWGIDFRGSLPMGDFQDLASFGVGGTGYAGYAFSPRLAVTARTGYIFTGGKEITETISGVTGTIKTNYGIVPLLGGLKVYINEGDTRFYAAGEAGMFFISTTGDLKNSLGGTITNVSGSDSKFGYAPAAGVQFRSGRTMMVDAHVDYTGIPDDAGDLSWVTFAVGVEWIIE